MQRSRIYRNGKLAESDFDLDRISDFAGQNDTFYWVDMVEPTEADLAELGAELGLSSFAVEDAFKGRQRPKLEHYDSHLFINVYGSKFDHESLELQTYEIAVFVTANGLITVRDHDGFDIESLMKRWDDSAELAANGVAFLLWGLLDLIVDGYFEVITELDQELEELEDLLFSENRKDSLIQRKSYALRKALVVLRRIAVPMREVLNPIIKRDTQVIGSAMFQYYQDIYDHVMRAADWTDSLRDLVTTLLETNLTIQGNRMNLVMKKVTSWAAIIAVPTAITGFYGQNVPYPGFADVSGFWASTIIILVGSGALYITFKKKDWL
jgi:magnesium transporter